MDYNCRDIPMRLDIRYQPLNFDIYLSQIIDIPKTSANEEPYNFQLEVDALKLVDDVIERTQKEEQDRIKKLKENILTTSEPLNPIPSSTDSSDPSSTNINIVNSNHQIDDTSSNNTNNKHNHIVNTLPAAPPSCPTETPLTPMKTVFVPCNSNDKPETSKGQNDEDKKPKVNQINPRDFEEMHYNPFDHLELQTIDELRELDLVFQASYANQNPTGSQIQPTPTIAESDSSTKPNFTLSRNLN